MTWGGRGSHYVAAGALAAGMLVWAAHAAWSSREIPVALPIVVTSAYDEWADTLGRREMLSDVLERAGITGREYIGFMKATHTLNPRRMQPGLIFEVRRVKGAVVANRLAVRLDPERHLVMARLGGDSGWTETVRAGVARCTNAVLFYGRARRQSARPSATRSSNGRRSKS